MDVEENDDGTFELSLTEYEQTILVEFAVEEILRREIRRLSDKK